MSFSLSPLSVLKGLSSNQRQAHTRDLRFQGHRTLQFDVFDPNTPMEDKTHSPMTLQQMSALHQFAKTVLNCFPNVHLLKNQQGHSAVIVTVNPLQKTLDIFYTDLIKHFLPQAIQKAGIELSNTQSQDGALTLFLESSRVGIHNQLDMPSSLQNKWKSWLSTQGIKPQEAEPEFPISTIEPYAISLNIGSTEPSIQKLQPFFS